MSPMRAGRLEVHHTDGREPTVYEDVEYWPWADSDAVTVWHAGGETKHKDVENTFVSEPVSR